MILSSYFDRLVSNVQPSETRISAISEAHNTLRDHLVSDAALKEPLDDSFLSGSYARSTATEPIKDADVIVVLKRKDLGANACEPSPAAVLRDLRDAIDQFYDGVDLQDQRRSVKVHLTEDDVTMDIVPAIAPDGKDAELWVPDRAQACWIRSNPAGHKRSAAETNDRTNGTFVQIAKVLKWWRREKLLDAQRPKSFLLEVLVARNAPSKPANACAAFEAMLISTRDALASHYRDQTMPVVEDPGLAGVDLAASCGWGLADFNYFFGELDALTKRVQHANDEKTPKDETIRLWQEIFGALYPSTLDDATDSSAARSSLPFRVRFQARIAHEQGGRVGEVYPSHGRKLPKHWWLYFEIIDTNVPPPYQIVWRVRNQGADARKAKDSGHVADHGQPHQWERLRYRGCHSMACEIWWDQKLIARAHHHVNIS